MPLQHAQEAINRIVHPISDMIDTLKTTLCNPLRNVLVPRGSVLRDVLVEDQKSLPPDPIPDDQWIVLDSITFAGLVVVLGYRTTCH